MNLKNGRHIDKRDPDSWGDNAYVFWLGNRFDPLTVLVRGDSFEDAYEWALCSPHLEPAMAVDPADYGGDLEALAADYPEPIINDNGVHVDDDWLDGCELATFARTYQEDKR